jgi:glycosyltransferase involved in cell wall biosynthesis
MKLNGRNITHTIRRKALSAIQQIFTKKKFGVLTPLSYPYLKLKVINDFNPDVVHIHNWYNILNYRLIDEIAQVYPIVFTLHDERLLTGGCHNTLGCGQNLSGCRNCPATHVMRKYIESDYHQKKNLFQNIPRYAIAAPSSWLTRKALESGVFANADRITQISNIIEPIRLNFTESVSTGIESTDFRILFVAADINVKLKGFEILAEAFYALTKRDHNRKYVLTAVGASADETKQINSNGKILFKRPVNQTKLYELMSQNSFLVVPSLSENSPNIISEAQMNGVIVIASNVGGIPEMIENGVTGFLFQSEVDVLTKCLLEVQNLKITQLETIRAEALKQSIKRHDSELITFRYEELYRSVQESNV